MNREKLHTFICNICIVRLNELSKVLCGSVAKPRKKIVGTEASDTFAIENA